MEIPTVPRIRRLSTLIGSVLVSLGCGTNYIYSAYAPQLGACLQLSYTQLNIIGLAANLGTSIFGPICGYVADHRGPRILLIGGSICLLVGYLGIKQMYDDCIGNGSAASTPRLALLVVCGFVTGVGSCGGFYAAMNATAKSFPSSYRATTTALVMSGFGLSAFFFSLLAYLVFPGDISSLLLTLAIGTVTLMLVGLLTIKPVPPTSSNVQAAIEDYDPIPREDSAILGGEVNNEVDADSVRLLSHDEEPTLCRVLVSPSNAEVDPPANLHHERIVEDSDVLPDIHGKRLWLAPDYHLIFTIIVICSGTGFMYINNVGSIARALYASTHRTYDEVEASKWQTTQVSIISLGSFAGRVSMGMISDFTYTRLRLPRAYSFRIISFLSILSQVTVMAVSSVETLWIATLLVGFAHGSLCGSYPSVLIEWFGLAHFSENMGFTEYAFVLGNNIFSLVFARVMDSHKTEDLLRMRGLFLSRELNSEHECLDGKACYLASLQVTLVACIVSFGLSWWASIREGQKVSVRNVYVPE